MTDYCGLDLKTFATTHIGHAKIDDREKIEEAVDYLMRHPNAMTETKVGSFQIDSSHWEIIDLIERSVQPMVVQYVRETVDRYPANLHYKAWAHLCLKGLGLNPHRHNEPVSAVMYLTDAKAALHIRDPRAMLASQWPQDILDKFYKNYVVFPKAGDIVIFPGYLDHYVQSDEPEFRISVAMDWMFE